MSRYSWEKPNWKKITIWGLIISLFFQILFLTVGFLWMRRENHPIKDTVKLGTVTYSSDSNNSSFDVTLKLSYNDFSYYTAKDVSYKLTFKDKSGAVLSEQTVALPEQLTKLSSEFTFAFGSGDLPAISGNVASVDSSLEGATFVNRIANEGGPTGMEYILEHWLILIGLLASFILVFLSAYTIELDGCFGYVLMFALLIPGLAILAKASTEIIVALCA